jgi:hypothetical protein
MPEWVEQNDKEMTEEETDTQKIENKKSKVRLCNTQCNQ